MGQLENAEFLPVVLHEESLECHEDFQMVEAFGPAEEFLEYPENFRVVGILGFVEGFRTAGGFRVLAAEFRPAGDFQVLAAEFRVVGEFQVGLAEGDFAEQNPSVLATGINGDG